MWSTLYGEKGNSETHKNQDVVETSVAILHGTEIEVGIVILD